MIPLASLKLFAPSMCMLAHEPHGKGTHIDLQITIFTILEEHISNYPRTYSRAKQDPI